MNFATRGLDRLDSEYLSQVFGQGRPRVSAALSSLSPSEAEPLVGLRRSLASLQDRLTACDVLAGAGVDSSTHGIGDDTVLTDRDGQNRAGRVEAHLVDADDPMNAISHTHSQSFGTYEVNPDCGW